MEKKNICLTQNLQSKNLVAYDLDFLKGVWKLDGMTVQIESKATVIYLRGVRFNGVNCFAN